MATNKSERFNQFVQWVSFGADSVIAENTRDEKRKFIKYNHLVANLLVFHNIVTLSRALDRLQADGLEASDQALATLTPYQTEHINRFGSYTVNFSRIPKPLPPTLRKSEGSGNKERPLVRSTQLIIHLSCVRISLRIVLIGRDVSAGRSVLHRSTRPSRTR